MAAKIFLALTQPTNHIALTVPGRSKSPHDSLDRMVPGHRYCGPQSRACNQHKLGFLPRVALAVFSYSPLCQSSLVVSLETKRLFFCCRFG